MYLFIHYMYHFVKIWRKACIDNLAENSNRASVYDILPPTLEDGCRNARPGVWCATYELTPVAWINTLSFNNQYSLETSIQ